MLRILRALLAVPDIIFSILLLIAGAGRFVVSLWWRRNLAAWRLERRLRGHGIDPGVAEKLAEQYRDMGRPLKYLRSRF
ncbi:hypothetical protein JW848_02475 [Candidatus Bipolaricaulota bacterium]|nr:hypothetical protein [Candidatus Bipolaricaulota bacterium]